MSRMISARTGFSMRAIAGHPILACNIQYNHATNLRTASLCQAATRTTGPCNI